jgi:hypothetical protein
MPEIDPVQAIEDLLNRLDDDTEEETLDDLDAFCRVAWPTLGAQNS